MKYYEGVTEEDKIKFGGSYVKEFNEGAEQYNFVDVNGFCYGYVSSKSTKGKANELHIEKIEGINDLSPEAEKVLVIWIARDPNAKHTKIIGWYKDATVYRTYQEKNIAFYNIKAKAENCVLLPVKKRNRIVYRATEIGPGKGPGMAEIWYAQDPLAKDIVKEHIDYIMNYDGPIQNKYLKNEEVDAISTDVISENEHHKKGDYYFENEDYRNAIKHYNAVIKLNQDNINAIYDKGMSLLRLRAYDEALKLFEKVTNIQTDEADDAYYWMGEIYFAFEKINKSQHCYNKAIKINPDIEDYRVGLINCYLYKGDSEAALAESSRIISKNKDSIVGYIEKANVLEQMGKYAEAIVAYDKCIRISMDSREIGNFFYKKAEMYFYLRKQEEALDSITKALEIDPEDGYYKVLKEQIIEMKRKVDKT